MSEVTGGLSHPPLVGEIQDRKAAHHGAIWIGPICYAEQWNVESTVVIVLILGRFARVTTLSVTLGRFSFRDRQ